MAPEQLRAWAVKARSKPLPVKDAIDMVCHAADALERLESARKELYDTCIEAIRCIESASGLQRVLLKLDAVTAKHSKQNG